MIEIDIKKLQKPKLYVILFYFSVLTTNTSCVNIKTQTKGVIMENKAKQTIFMAKMKVYEAFKNKIITEEQANYFIDLIEKAQIKIQVQGDLITNEYPDVVDNIYNSCITKAKEQGYGYSEYPLISEMNEEQYSKFLRDSAILKLKAFAIYISKTSVVHNNKAVMLEDITGESYPFPTADLRYAKGNAILEEKFILQDYLKRKGMNESYRELMSDINFTCGNR